MNCDCYEGTSCPAPDLDTSIHRLGFLDEVRWERCPHGSYLPIWIESGRLASVVFY